MIRLVQETLFANENHASCFVKCLRWFNATFNLSLDLDGQTDQAERKRAEIGLKMRKEARELAEWKEQMQFRLYLLSDRILEMLENQRDDNVPTRPDETWNKQFCNAIRAIPAAEVFTEKCLMKCMKES